MGWHWVFCRTHSAIGISPTGLIYLGETASDAPLYGIGKEQDELPAQKPSDCSSVLCTRATVSPRSSNEMIQRENHGKWRTKWLPPFYRWNRPEAAVSQEDPAPRATTIHSACRPLPGAPPATFGCVFHPARLPVPAAKAALDDVKGLSPALPVCDSVRRLFLLASAPSAV
ncbi:uncharacterized protein PHA67_006673 [Liasis olivaceus]